jgi:DNA topoisomerase-1
VVSVRPGRFGPYVNHGKVNATLPKDTDPESVTLEQAVELINAKAGSAPAKPARKTAAKGSAGKAPAKGSAKKPAAKKAPAKKKAPES